MSEKCVCCGAAVPEGRQVCVECEKAAEDMRAYAQGGPPPCACCADIRERVLAGDARRAYEGLAGQDAEDARMTATVLMNGWTIGRFPMRFCPMCGANMPRRIRSWRGISSYPPRRRTSGRGKEHGRAPDQGKP